MSLPGPTSEALGVVTGIGRRDVIAALDTLSSVLAQSVVVLGSDDPQLPIGTDVVRLPAAESVLRGLLHDHPWVVLHDPACAGVTADQVRRMAGLAGDTAVVTVQPVLETLKLVRDHIVVSTVDREKLRVVASPVAAPGPTLAAISDLSAALSDPATLVRELRAAGPVELVEGPAEVRRAFDG